MFQVNRVREYQEFSLARARARGQAQKLIPGIGGIEIAMPAKILYVDVTCSVLETRQRKHVLRNANAIKRNTIIMNMVMLMCDRIC